MLGDVFSKSDRRGADRGHFALGCLYLQGLLEETKAVDIDLDASTLEFVLRRRIEAMAEVVAANVADLRSIARLRKAVHLARSLPFSVNIWWVQNLCHERITRAYNEFLVKAEAGDKDAQAWISQVSELSKELCFSVRITDSAQFPTMAD